MSTAMYEITNEKSDFEKGYLDLELHMVNAKELKVIDASMLVIMILVMSTIRRLKLKKWPSREL